VASSAEVRVREKHRPDPDCQWDWGTATGLEQGPAAVCAGDCPVQTGCIPEFSSNPRIGEPGAWGRRVGTGRGDGAGGRGVGTGRGDWAWGLGVGTGRLAL